MQHLRKFPPWILVFFVLVLCLVLFMFYQKVEHKEHLPMQRHYEVPEIPVPNDQT